MKMSMNRGDRSLLTFPSPLVDYPGKDLSFGLNMCFRDVNQLYNIPSDSNDDHGFGTYLVLSFWTQKVIFMA